MARTCYYTNEGMAEDFSGTVVYKLALIEEGVPGYRVTESAPDLLALQALARARNEKAGLSERDVHAIVASSMAAGPVPR